MAESVDALVSNTSGATRAGSTPALGTEKGEVLTPPFSVPRPGPNPFLFLVRHSERAPYGRLAALRDRSHPPGSPQYVFSLVVFLYKSTCRKIRQVRQEGKRTVNREITMFNLDMIISVGYKVNSKRGVRFRQWANEILKQYIIKGYAVNERMRREQIAELRQLVGMLCLEHSQSRGVESLEPI